MRRAARTRAGRRGFGRTGAPVSWTVNTEPRRVPSGRTTYDNVGFLCALTMPRLGPVGHERKRWVLVAQGGNSDTGCGWLRWGDGPTWVPVALAGRRGEGPAGGAGGGRGAPRA